MALRTGKNLRIGLTKAPCALHAGDQETVGAGTGHHTVVQVHRAGDGRCVQVGLHVQLFIVKQRTRVMVCVVTLRNRNAAKILALRAVLVHVMLRNQCERAIRPRGAIRVGGID